MKKTVLALLSVIYLLVASGMTFSVHYCMGERGPVKFGMHTPDICGRCGMKESESRGCCRDEHLVVKLKEDQQKNQLTASPFAPVFELPPVAEFALRVPETITPPEHLIFSDISPPPLLKDRNIFFSNFRV